VRRGGGRKHHSGRVRTNMISSDNTEGGGEADENGEEATDGASSSIKKKKGKGEFDVTRAELRKTLAVFGATLERLGRVSLQAADHHIYVVEDRTSEVRLDMLECRLLKYMYYMHACVSEEGFLKHEMKILVLYFFL